MKKMKVFVIFGFIFVIALIMGIGYISVANESQAKSNEVEQVEKFLGEEESAAEIEQTEEIAVVDEKKNDWVDQWFAPDKIAMYFTWLAYIGTIIGIAVNLAKVRKMNHLTLKNVSDELKEVLKANITDSVNVGLDKYLPQIAAGQEKANKIMEIFAKVLALSQEDTPESKVAILNLIQELGTVGQELINNSKEIIEASQKAIEEHQEEVEERLDEIIEKYDGTSI